MGDLNRRGIVQGMDDIPAAKEASKAKCRWPNVRLRDPTLRSLTQGRATYSMEFKHYPRRRTLRGRQAVISRLV